MRPAWVMVLFLIMVLLLSAGMAALSVAAR